MPRPRRVCGGALSFAQVRAIVSNKIRGHPLFDAEGDADPMGFLTPELGGQVGALLCIARGASLIDRGKPGWKPGGPGKFWIEKGYGLDGERLWPVARVGLTPLSSLNEGPDLTELPN